MMGHHHHRSPWRSDFKHFKVRPSSHLRCRPDPHRPGSHHCRRQGPAYHIQFDLFNKNTRDKTCLLITPSLS